MLIAFEGIDGSGKATQARMLHQRLNGSELFSFPTYDTSVFGPHVRRYLRGEFGELGQNDPFLVAMLYAINRYEALPDLQAALAGGLTVICDRYVPSNIAHQAANEPVDSRAALIYRIEQTEYEIFGLPRPDLVILLDLTAEASYRRTHTRDDTKDLHQDSLSYMARVRDVYLEQARTYRRWHVVDCVDDEGYDKTREHLHDEIYQVIEEARAAQVASA